MKTRRMRILITVLALCLALATLFVACGEVAPAHTHDLSNGYGKDAENHWQICSECGEKINFEPHKWSEWVTTDDEGGSVSSRYCTVCGEQQTNEESGNEGGNEGGTDTTKGSCYWGLSIYDEDLIAKTEYDENGRISVTHHYLACVEMMSTYGALGEEIREVYEYDESGKLTRIKVYEDYMGSMFGIFGSYTKPELIVEYGFVYGSDGKMSKIEQYYEGRLDDETYILCVYGTDGELERLDVYESYSSSWEITASFFLEDGRIVKVTEDGDTSEIIYGEDGNVSSVKGDALWQNMAYEYDANGNPTTIIFDVGGEEETSIIYTYNADGTIKETQMTGDSTAHAEFNYDANGLPATVTVSDTIEGKELTLFVINTEFDGNRLLSKFEYKMLNPENTEQWGSAVMNIERNAKGLLTRSEMLTYSSVSPDKADAKQVTVMEYDALDNVILETEKSYSLDRTTGKYVVRSEGTTKNEYDANGNKTFYESIYCSYDEMGNIGYSSKSTTAYVYENGVKVKEEEIDYSYNQETKTFEERYKFVTEYNKDGSIKSEKYYSDGELKSECFYSARVNGKGTYLSREISYWNGYKTVYEYNEKGETTKQNDYDAAGNVIAAYDYEYTYDSEGNMTSKKTYQNGRLTDVYEYVYNADGDRVLKKYVYYYEDGGYSVSEYNEKGDIIGELEYAADGTVTYGFRYEYRYDEHGNLVYKKDINAVTNKTEYENEWVSYYNEEYDYWDKYESKWIYYGDDGSKHVFEYNEYGDTVRQADYNPDGSLNWGHVYEITRNENGYLIYEKTYDFNGRLINEKEYGFRTSNIEVYGATVCIKEIQYEEDGTKCITKHDTIGWTISEEYFDANGNLVGARYYENYYQIDTGRVEYRKEYDMSRNLVGEMRYEIITEYEHGYPYYIEVEIWSKSYGEGGYVTEWEYEIHYEYGYPSTRHVRTTSYEPNGNKGVTEYYDNGNWRTYTYYDKDGNILEQRRFDRDGNEIGSRG